MEVNVDFGHGAVSVTDRAITAAVASSGFTATSPHLDDHVAGDPDALIFTSPEGHPLRRTKFRPKWLEACTTAGVVGLHFHDLRGSGATWAAADGATVRELMGRLGHKTPMMALRYQHATQERDRVIADKLGARMRPAAEDEAKPSADLISLKR
ncbi:MAG: tyrosine-type recombinase/integrase [Acidimicrobiales bacterium]